MSGFRGQVYRLGTHQSANYTSAAGTIANAFSAGTQLVRVVPTTAAYVKIGNSPTATASDVYMAAGQAETFIVTPGMKASALRVTTNGALHVTEVSG
jgi:hypothetical protein